MNIKIRLALQFTLIVAVILLFFSGLVYYFSYSSQLTKFRQNLLDRAKNTATLFIDVAEVDSSLLRKIQQSTISWEQEELVLVDSSYNIIYGNNINYLSDKELLINSADGNLSYFSVAETDGVCFKHSSNGQTFYVFSIALDKSRMQNLSDLRKILVWSIIFSIWLSVLFSYFFAKRSIKPISEIIKRVKEINSLKLSSRLDEGDKKDEIAQLAITFNEMLSDLEIAFKNQDDFVTNASHELRTPLTVMIGESDYILGHENSKEEYATYLANINSDLKKINSLLNNLLELAQINRNNSAAFSKVRIDEIIFNSVYKVKTKYPGRRIVSRILYTESEEDLFINGNEGLLTLAFINLLDNACKFSSEDVTIEAVITDEHVNVIVSDTGIGIPESEIETVYRPFTRASNVKYIGGFGIGLSLVVKIISLHNASLDIISEEKKGTVIKIPFKRIPS
jgi:signal transduction histidine kinase